jgi:DNA-binding response OmpR family regulator
MHNVLVIDDDDAVRSVVVDTLTHFGFAAREAKDGKTGILMASETPPDLIICDVRMPGMDGFQTLAALRDLPETSNIPFIFLTAAQDKHNLRRGMISGADDYVTKPFTCEELLDAVTTRLARQTELKCDIYRRAERLRKDVDHLLSQELARPLNGILGVAADLMRAPATLAPDEVSANARRIQDSAARLSQLAKSLA